MRPLFPVVLIGSVGWSRTEGRLPIVRRAGIEGDLLALEARENLPHQLTSLAGSQTLFADLSSELVCLFPPSATLGIPCGPCFSSY